ncbi:MAG: hypothetical protein IJ306_06295 [Oscillospiraceae bacterium]|nr:hypothetical protein [Oscillospiraceae bacterium]
MHKMIKPLIIAALLFLCILFRIHIAKDDVRPDIKNESPSINEKISLEEISVTPTLKILPSAYDYIELEIANNSKYPLWLNSSNYNIYEKTAAGYILIDVDNDGFTYNGEKNFKAVEDQSTQRIRFYLGELIDNSYTRKGNYKIEIPLDETFVVETYFEITDETLNPDTGIFIACDAEYSADNEGRFNYTLTNGSEEDIQVTLAVIISQYKDGKWVRLPLSEKYYDVHYNASLLSENLPAGSQLKQEFSLSLADMVGMELMPGKYRLEKQIAFNWYFAEFEIY